MIITLLTLAEFGLKKHFTPISSENNSNTILFFSLTNSVSRATTFISKGKDFKSAWINGKREAIKIAKKLKLKRNIWLRIDWPTDITQTNWGSLQEQLSVTKRNYFRYGIALDKKFKNAFLEVAMQVRQHLDPWTILITGTNDSKNLFSGSA